MSQDTVTITIDGVEIQAKPDQTVIQAADDAGIYIPRLCHHPSLPPAGHCRLCTVKINGRHTNSCTYPVSDGLVIESEVEEINAYRRQLVEMLFVEGNHHCPSCEASGECELQAMAYRLGMLAPTLPYFRKHRDLDASHKDIYIDRDRCILCGRCARASALEDHKTALGFEGRGAEKRIAVDGKALADTPMEARDRAASICPTGSLVVKREGYAKPVGTRTYDKTPIGTNIEQKRQAG